MGFLMMLVTTLIHAGFMMITMHRLAAHEQNPQTRTLIACSWLDSRFW